jgi:hypothetical protein
MDEVKLGTFCGNCSFYDEGCTIDVLDTFVSVGAEIVDNSGTPAIDRICPYFNTLGLSLEDAQEKVRIGGTVVVLAHGDDSLDDIKTTVSKLQGVAGYDKFKLVVGHGTNLLPSEVKKICKDHSESDFTAVQVMDGDAQNFIDEAFKRTKNGMILVLRAGRDFDEKCLSILNQVMNVKMRRVLYVKAVEDVHMMCFMATVYKMMKGSKIFLFHDKITQVAAQQGKTDLLWDWERVYEANRC